MKDVLLVIVLPIGLVVGIVAALMPHVQRGAADASADCKRRAVGLCTLPMEARTVGRYGECLCVVP